MYSEGSTGSSGKISDDGMITGSARNASKRAIVAASLSCSETGMQATKDRQGSRDTTFPLFGFSLAGPLEAKINVTDGKDEKGTCQRYHIICEDRLTHVTTGNFIKCNLMMR